MRGVRILGVSPTPTHPTTAGNRARYRALLDRLQQQGAVVRLIHVDQEPGDLDAMHAHWSGGAVRLPFNLPIPRHTRWNRFARRCRKYLGVKLDDRTDVDDWFDPAIIAPFETEVRTFKPHAVLMLYFWYSALLDLLPAGVLRILDAQDVFTDRAARMAKAGIPQEWFSVSAKEESRGLARFDTVLAIQDFEAQHYRALARTPVVTVGHFLPIIETGRPPVEPILLIIGSDNDVNIHGVRWFLAEVWPAVIADRPDARLRVAGKVCAHLNATAGVELCGVVADLGAVYSGSSLVLNPLRGGTGLKIKGAEALGAGRAVVSTPSAALGLERAVGRGLVVCASAPEMASTVLSLLSDGVALALLGQRAREFAVEWNAAQTGRFDAVFDDVRLKSGHTSHARSRDNREM